MDNPRTLLVRALLRLNNRITRWRRVRVAPDRVLLLLAHCLQHGTCVRNLTQEGGDGCARCGRCPINALLTLQERYGVQIHIAGGGRQALAKARSGPIEAVVAVACERELLGGIVGVFPRPVLAVLNTRPLGDCHDTQVDLTQVKLALCELMRTAPSPTTYSRSNE